jgi:hypothetical protein
MGNAKNSFSFSKKESSNLSTVQRPENNPIFRVQLKAFTAAALILPGLLQVPAYAADDDEVDFQYSHYEEGKRNVATIFANPGGNGNSMTTVFGQNHPIEVDSIRGSSKITLTDRVKFAFNYTQDTWSGATPMGTAPAAFGSNNVFHAMVDGPISGATPLLQRISPAFDSQGNPMQLISGNVSQNPIYIKNTQLAHTMSYASPETRKQGDFKLNYQWDEAQLDVGGGISIENDYESRFGNLGGRWDFNHKLTSLNAGISYTNSATKATLDPYAVHWMDFNHYIDNNQIYRSNGQVILHGNREDWAPHIGLSQVLGKDTLIETSLGYTRSTGFMANPYKVTQVFEISPNDLPDQNGVFQLGGGGAYVEQRPGVRNQWSWDAKLVQYVAPLDAAVHFDYRFYHDDWGINAHTFEADWGQPLGAGWNITPRVRYYSQDAANFYHSYMLFTTDQYGNYALPANFSSDQRLSAYGALSGGVTVSKQFAKGVSLETGFEYYSHAGSLKMGGGGEGSYADFNYYVANAALKINLSALNFGGSSGGHSDPAHQHASAPAGVIFSHMIDKSDRFMVGYRYMRNRDAGGMLHGTDTAGDTALLANGCASYGCYMKPLEMTMNMHMLDLMYAPTDWLNLMLMPQFVDTEMTMAGIPGAPRMPGMTTMNTQVMVDNHQTGGVGDTGMYAMFKLFEQPGQHAHLSLGISAPSGDVAIRNRRTQQGSNPAFFVDYGMQLGSGTWDFKPSLTYTGHLDEWSWGGQLSGTKRLEAQNQSGYALGDIFQTTAWGGYNLTHWLTASVRGIYTWQGTIKGEYTKDVLLAPGYCSNFFTIGFPYKASCTAAFATITASQNAANHTGTFNQTSNYGGQYVDVGLGLNVNIPNGTFAGHSLSFEWLQPAYTNVNGYQLNRDGALAVSWSKSF